MDVVMRVLGQQPTLLRVFQNLFRHNKFHQRFSLSVPGLVLVCFLARYFNSPAVVFVLVFCFLLILISNYLLALFFSPLFGPDIRSF